MLNNYLKIAWRNIVKNGLHSLINIFGLTTGIVFTLLIGAYVWNELQVNKSVRSAKNQYFLKSEWKDPNLGTNITTLGPLAKRLKEDYPHLVANYYRWDGITSVVSNNEKHFRENIQLGDSTMLSMYGFNLLHGDVRTALNNPFSVVVTQEVAMKYFGKTDIVGETVSIQSFSGSQRDFVITGVLQEIPRNSVTNLNAENNNTLFIPTNTYTYFGRFDFESWANLYIPSYIELQKGITAEDLAKPIEKLIQENAPDGIKSNLSVVPVKLTDYYLQAQNGVVQRMLYTLSFVGLFILLMAIVNYINISISSSTSRMKEIGMRKVMGGLKKQIIAQFLIESILIVFLATTAAIGLYSLIMPLFEELVEQTIPGLGSFPIFFVLIPILFVLIIGIVSGLYPAFVLSSMQSVDSVKGKIRTVKENLLLRKSLIVFQFSVAAVVLIAAYTISEQTTYFFSRNLGYNKEYIVASQVPRDWSPAGVRRMETIRDEFAAMPGIASVSLSYEIPNGMNGGQPPVYKVGTDSTQAIAMQALVTDGNYLHTYQISKTAGSFFSNGEVDSSKIVLNETAVNALGWSNPEEAIGKHLKIPNNNVVYTVQGISSDFHFGSMQQTIAPMIFFHIRSANTYRYLSFKIKPGNIGNSIDAIQKRWTRLLPGSSFEYNFLDDTLKKLYASELQLKKAALTATILAMVIVLLGVSGLLSLSIQKRTKEIGIRKVLGASASGIISLFLKEFVPVLLVGGVISIPVAWAIMQGWLNSYAYRIDLSIVPFLSAVIALALITIILISIRVASASSQNPVKSLRAD